MTSTTEEAHMIEMEKESREMTSTTEEAHMIEKEKRIALDYAVVLYRGTAAETVTSQVIDAAERIRKYLFSEDIK